MNTHLLLGFENSTTLATEVKDPKVSEREKGREGAGGREREGGSGRREEEGGGRERGRATEIGEIKTNITDSDICHEESS